MAPRIQYAKTEDGVSIAYWTLGEGEPIVYLPWFPFGHIELEWQNLEHRRFCEGLAQAAPADTVPSLAHPEVGGLRGGKAAPDDEIEHDFSTVGFASQPDELACIRVILRDSHSPEVNID